MTLIKCDSLVDGQEVMERTKKWLEKRNFETKTLKNDVSYLVKARKSGAIRTFLGADRALEVCIRNNDQQTQVEIRQGSWKKTL